MQRFFFGWANTQIDVCLIFLDIIADKLKSKYGHEAVKGKCWITGHSLGAHVGQMAYFLRPNLWNLYAGTYGFENPGITETYKVVFLITDEKELPYAPPCVNILTRPNLINRCQRQIGATYTLNTSYAVDDGTQPIYPLPKSISVLHPINSAFYIKWTSQQHEMELILKELRNDPEFFWYEDSKTPYTINLGYRDYLSIEKREGMLPYWKNYATYIWETRPDIRAGYKRQNAWEYHLLREVHELSVEIWHREVGLRQLRLGVNIPGTLFVHQPEPTDPELADFVVIEREEEFTMLTL